MTITLAIAPGLAFGLCIFALVIMFICGIWMLVVAFQRSFPWLLGCIFIPFVSFILVIVEPKARPPFFVYLATCAALITMIILVDTPRNANMGPWDRLGYIFSEKARNGSRPNRYTREETTPPPAAARAPSVAARTETLRAWQMELERKRAALNPNDPTALAQFNRELEDYKAQLQQVKAAAAQGAP